jgi:hypothetical protein
MDMDITGSYPIILDGETTGELSVSREGLFWCFEARSEGRGELVRLSVYGEGREGYLGIMEPFGEMLRLTKKLSRAALRDFPLKISYAGQAGESDNTPLVREEKKEAQETQEEKEYNGEFPLSYYNNEKSTADAPPEDDKPPPNTDIYPQDDVSLLNWHPCPVPCSLFSGLEEKQLCTCIGGALSVREGEMVYLAVPEGVAELMPPSGAIRFDGQAELFGEIYHICKIENGRCISGF